MTINKDETRLYMLTEEQRVIEVAKVEMGIRRAEPPARFVWPRLHRKKFQGKVRFKPVDGPGLRLLRRAVAKLRRRATLRMHLRLKRHGKNWRHLKLPKVPAA